MKFFSHSKPCLVFLLCGVMSTLAAVPACAVVLGDLRTTSRLGERLRVEIDLVVQPNSGLEAGCIHLKKPQESDYSWLREGAYGIRQGLPTVLTIQSQKSILEPVIQLGVYVGCGFEVQRDYTVFLSPPPTDPTPPSVVILPTAYSAVVPRGSARQAAAHPASIREESGSVSSATVVKHLRVPEPAKDRLVLFGAGDGNDLSLALSSQFSSWSEEAESRDRDTLRKTLRMEYRLLQALHQQAVALLEAAEKLRQLEQTLSDLQQKTDVLGKGTGSDGVVVSEVPSSFESLIIQPGVSLPAAPVVVSNPVAVAPVRAAVKVAGGDPTRFYIVLLLMALFCGAWLFWRHTQRRKMLSRFSAVPPVLLVAPPRALEPESRDPLDVELEAEEESRGRNVATVDIPLGETIPPSDFGEPGSESFEVSPVVTELQVAVGTLDEHVEVNPVMELADIMLSFGRVKGAAQALQEFVDHSPEEALHPWIRLMDVYRLAGMRAEFEQVAANLNQYFNVEVQTWDEAGGGVALVPKDGVADRTGAHEEPLPIQWPTSSKKARGVEEMVHICNQIIEKWYGQPGIDYLQSLLRDNRGGLRTGFTIEVVDEILFLTDIQETLLKMDAEAAAENQSESNK